MKEMNENAAELGRMLDVLAYADKTSYWRKDLCNNILITL